MVLFYFRIKVMDLAPHPNLMRSRICDIQRKLFEEVDAVKAFAGEIKNEIDHRDPDASRVPLHFFHRAKTAANTLVSRIEIQLEEGDIALAALDAMGLLDDTSAAPCCSVDKEALANKQQAISRYVHFLIQSLTCLRDWIHTFFTSVETDTFCALAALRLGDADDVPIMPFYVSLEEAFCRGCSRGQLDAVLFLLDTFPRIKLTMDNCLVREFFRNIQFDMALDHDGIFKTPILDDSEGYRRVAVVRAFLELENHHPRRQDARARKEFGESISWLAERQARAREARAREIRIRMLHGDSVSKYANAPCEERPRLFKLPPH